MSEKITGVLWSKDAEEDLDDIFSFYLDHAPSKSHDIIQKIITDSESIIFTQQYQIDEYDSKSRRFFVQGKFRVLYQLYDTIAMITGVYPTKANPEKIRSKQ